MQEFLTICVVMVSGIFLINKFTKKNNSGCDKCNCGDK